MTELLQALKKLKPGKAADTNHIIAEMLKLGGLNLRKALLDLFNSILEPNAPTPQQWRHERSHVKSTLVKYKQGTHKYQARLRTRGRRTHRTMTTRWN